MESVAGSANIEPFWSRLLEVYKYPLSVQGIATILLLAVLSVLLQGLFLLAIAPSIAITLYAFACLRRTAGGENDAPGVEASFEGSVAPVFYVGICMFIAVLLAMFAFKTLGLGLGIILSFLLVLIMPAVIIMIAIEEQLLPALNLANVLNIIKATGVSYFVMVLFNIIMLSSMGILVETFGNTNFNSLSVFLTSAIGNYYTIVVYHIMGYLVYQNHSELGYRVSGRAGLKNASARTPKQRQRLQLELLVKAGQYDAARDIAAQACTSDAPIWDWERAFKLFCAANPGKKLATFFYAYLDRLREADDSEKVVQAYLAVSRLDPDFQLSDDARRLEVANALHIEGQHSLAVNLIKRIPQESQQQTKVADALDLLAKCFKHISGGEKHASHFETEHALHVARQKRAAREASRRQQR